MKLATTARKKDALKKLNSLAPINAPELYRQVSDLLKKGVDFTPEKAEEYGEDGTYDLLYKLLTIHREYFAVEPFGDIFGDYLMENELLSDRAGQFFTPINVCDMMVKMTFTVEGAMDEFKTILDPASGSGRFMVRTAKHYYEAKKPFNFIFTNIDIDHRMWTYTTMNAVLHNIPSINIHGDSLALKYWGAYAVVPTHLDLGAWYALDPKKVRARHIAMLEANRQPQGMEKFVGKLKVRDKPVEFKGFTVKPKQKKLFDEE